MADTVDDSNLDQSGSAVDAIALAADIVAAYVSKNSLPAADLASFLTSVHRAVVGLSNSGAGSPGAKPGEEVEKPMPAQIRKSVRPNGITSFLDGKSYKTLKRHLTTHGLDPHSYRARYDLPSDYPMVAPNYSEQRAALAKSIGLGRPGGRAQSDSAKAEAAGEPKRRRRSAA